MLLKVVAGKAKHCRRATADYRNTSHQKEQNGLRIKVKVFKRRRDDYMNTDGDRQIFDS
jgi:hypothetical protein